MRRGSVSPGPRHIFPPQEEAPKVKYLIFVTVLSLFKVNMIRANLVDIRAPVAVVIVLLLLATPVTEAAETPSQSGAPTCVSGFCLQEDYNRLEVGPGAARIKECREYQH